MTSLRWIMNCNRHSFLSSESSLREAPIPRAFKDQRKDMGKDKRHELSAGSCRAPNDRRDKSLGNYEVSWETLGMDGSRSRGRLCCDELLALLNGLHEGTGSEPDWRAEIAF